MTDKEYFELQYDFKSKVLNLIEAFQNEVISTFDGIHYHCPQITSENELGCRLWHNFGRIKDFNALGGYVVLTDNTIICVNSSSWIAQFDGCKESDITHNPF